MPILRYFALVGPALLGLLFVAEARLPQPGPLPNSSEFHGLPQGRPQQPKATHLTVTWAPAPDMASPAVRLAAGADDANPRAQPQKSQTTKTAQVEKRAPKKPRRVHRRLAPPPYPTVAQVNPWGWRGSEPSQF